MANFCGSFYILCSEYGWSKSIKEKILDLLSKYNLYPCRESVWKSWGINGSKKKHDPCFGKWIGTWLIQRQFKQKYYEEQLKKDQIIGKEQKRTYSNID